LQFAHTLVSESAQATRMHKEPIALGEIRGAKAPDIPSVLVELGYVTNKRQTSSP